MKISKEKSKRKAARDKLLKDVENNQKTINKSHGKTKPSNT